MKALFFFFLALSMQITNTSSAGIDSQSDLKDALIPTDLSNGVLTGSARGESGKSFLDAVFAFIRDSLFDVLVLLAIGMFIFIGARLVIARGNPEEFKKAMKSLVYAAVGIFAVAIAWALVRFVAGLNI